MQNENIKLSQEKTKKQKKQQQVFYIEERKPCRSFISPASPPQRPSQFPSSSAAAAAYHALPNPK